MVYLASGTFWGNLNALVASACAFAVSVFFAHFFTKEAYGTYQYILSIASLIGAATLTGMNGAVTRAVARGFEGELKRSVRYQLKASVAPFVIGICISAWYFIHDNKALALAFLWIAIFLPLQSAYNTWVAYLGGKKFFRVGTYYGLANNVGNYAATLIAIYLFRDYLWLVFISYAFTFLNTFVIYKLVIRNIPPNDKQDNETLSYGTHLSAMGIFGTFASQLDALLVFHFVGSAALATYSFATIIPERLTGLLKFIPNIAMPKLAEYDEHGVRAFVSSKIWVLAGLLTIASILYALLSPWLFHIFFPTYVDAIPFTQAYSLAFFSLLGSVLTTALTAQRRTRELYIINTAMPFVRAGLLAGLMYAFGIWGLLWAQIASNFISITIQYIFLQRPSSTIS